MSVRTAIMILKVGMMTTTTMKTTTMKTTAMSKDLDDVEKAERILKGGYCHSCFDLLWPTPNSICVKCSIVGVQPLAKPAGEIFKMKVYKGK